MAYKYSTEHEPEGFYSYDPWGYDKPSADVGGISRGYDEPAMGEDGSEFEGIGSYSSGDKDTDIATRLSLPSRSTEDSYTPTTTTTSMTPTMEMPTMGGMPTYTAPEVSEQRLGELTRKAMGAPMGKQRMALSEALRKSGYSDNPNVRALEKEKALSGYGQGISDIRAGASREAMQEYQPEYQAAVTKAGLEYQTAAESTRSKFLADMQKYMTTMKQETTTRRAEDEQSRYRIPFRA